LHSHPRWYLVQCRARQDERALEHLERQGFECYRPLYEGERIRGGRKELASVAIFPAGKIEVASLRGESSNQLFKLLKNGTTTLSANAPSRQELPP
jgi:hypothetical protein